VLVTVRLAPARIALQSRFVTAGPCWRVLYSVVAATSTLPRRSLAIRQTALRSFARSDSLVVLTLTIVRPQGNASCCIGGSIHSQSTNHQRLNNALGAPHLYAIGATSHVSLSEGKG